MSYFNIISEYQTYSGSESDFHYDFNANSGGGQAFLGGKIVDAAGNQTSSRALEGLAVSFALRIRNKQVSLASGGSGTYAISARGKDSQSMKLSVQGKINPNRLIAAALMLPRTCGRNMACSLDVSPLTTDNYWLRSMWLDVDKARIGTVAFIPKDFVFEGGLSKRQGVTHRKDVVEGESQFFKLDYNRRVEDIIALADDISLPSYVRSALGYYRDIYTGSVDYEYEKSEAVVADLMRDLSLDYCDSYSGYSDPLNFVAELSERKNEGARFERIEIEGVRQPHNLIFFGAPGTGKSYQMNVSANEFFDDDKIRRVTFHPDYTYAQFVGSFKPYSDPDNSNEIAYKYISGPFLDTYLDAIAHPDNNYVLIIEELNRANPAAVFGNVFQLLDRDGHGNSEYSVATQLEMRAAIAAYFNSLKRQEKEFLESYYDDIGFDHFCDMSMKQLSLPSNMYLWATMNSADQGVYPMDTAFKRRWDFEYLGLNDGEGAVSSYEVPDGETGKKANWNKLRRVINRKLQDAKVNEDKLLGPFFIPPKVLEDPDRFNDVFKGKVLLYLYEDAAKTKRNQLFKDAAWTYSEISKLYDEAGAEGIFDGVRLSEYEASGNAAISETSSEDSEERE